MKLIKGIIFGVDLFNGLVWFVVLTLGFWYSGLLIPNGYLTHMGLPVPVHFHPFSISLWWWHMPASVVILRLLIAVAVAALAAILPDLDMVPYKLIRKGKEGMWLGSGLLWWIASLWIFSTFRESSILWLGFLGLFVAFQAFIARDRVIKRASHWPLWHHPILVILIVFGLVWLVTGDFGPQYRLYFELLLVPPVIVHFLHDGLQPQGFPFLAPFSDAHYQWHWIRFERVSDLLVRQHYQRQATVASTQTLKEDVERRTDKVTLKRVILLLLAGSAVAATLYYL